MVAEIVAEAGIVRNHDATMCLPTSHWTILALTAAPTPMTLDATTCVEDTGAPRMVEPNREDADTS